MSVCVSFIIHTESQQTGSNDPSDRRPAVNEERLEMWANAQPDGRPAEYR